MNAPSARESKGPQPLDDLYRRRHCAGHRCRGGRTGQSPANSFAVWWTVLEVGGEVFLRMLQMVVVPLVMASVMSGILGLGDVRKLGRPGTYAVSYYLMHNGFGGGDRADRGEHRQPRPGNRSLRWSKTRATRASRPSRT